MSGLSNFRRDIQDSSFRSEFQTAAYKSKMGSALVFLMGLSLTALSPSVIYAGSPVWGTLFCLVGLPLAGCSYDVMHVARNIEEICEDERTRTEVSESATKLSNYVFKRTYFGEFLLGPMMRKQMVQ